MLLGGAGGAVPAALIRAVTATLPDSVGGVMGIFSRMLPLESLFRELNDRGGRYVVVGGLAVVLHGHLGATGDVDLVIDLARDQVDRTLCPTSLLG